MNERIKELAEQACIRKEIVVKGSGTYLRDMNNELERFTELIVRECAKEAFEFWCSQIDPTEESAENHILKYFGVE